MTPLAAMFEKKQNLMVPVIGGDVESMSAKTEPEVVEEKPRKAEVTVDIVKPPKISKEEAA